jgi:hypothetical protein
MGVILRTIVNLSQEFQGEVDVFPFDEFEVGAGAAQFPLERDERIKDLFVGDVEGDEGSQTRSVPAA